MNRRAVILLAEDDENDVTLMKLAYARIQFPHPLHVVNNGAKVIEYLAGEGHYSDRERCPLPSLLLLDLKMPIKNGFDVLSWIRARPGLKRLVVVVLTSSREPSDIDRAYDLGANSFAIKPGSFEDLVSVLKRLESWWIAVNQTPNLKK